MTPAILVRRPSDLTVAWAQRVVAHHAAGATVSRVAVLSADIGTTTRVRVAVEHNGPEALPRRWFVKLPSRSWRARCITALPRLLQTEVRFYQEVTQAVPVLRPAMLAAQSLCGRGTTLVLADVTEHGAVPGGPGDALTEAQATAVVEQLAGLHARFWNTTSLDREYRWLAGPIRRWEDRLGTALAVPLMRRGLQRAGSAVPIALHTPAVDYARRRRHMMRLLADGPRTLVHHDVHPGNLFWQQSQPGFLDWQLVRIGEGIGDVAYCLATALAPDIRRTCEARLLARYQQVLEKHQIADLDPTTLRQRYRAHLTYAFEAMVVTLAIGDLMPLDSNLELIRRAAAAVEDHDALAVEPANGEDCS
ncbi:aminoglycoside phosphotransferase [Candidatus Methylomirabilis lanthanidiphila]|uniref:Aminoglycoside phosphotransferase n=1 Tax=Candidatus Methylomirabilis lanthanidiphila TaxID=2211376 RepID=A0A564ZNJ1_9BACT|nr:aminoglycoside phosphotransferase family protein [Candidatus Methylomirabilis lanthanidiphila]VUZ86222.1 aminoglycoside phosphotransferase [Candidatus Methylomirabilis lanthanidiphila]